MVLYFKTIFVHYFEVFFSIVIYGKAFSKTIEKLFRNKKTSYHLTITLKKKD